MTSTSVVRAYYRKTGFTPSDEIEPQLKVAVDQMLPAGHAPGGGPGVGPGLWGVGLARGGGWPGAEPCLAAAAEAGSKRSVWQTAFFVLAGVAIFAAALIYATSVRKTAPTANLVAHAGSLPV